MRVQSFFGKVSVEALHQLDHHVNAWLEGNGIEPRIISQSVGYDKPKEDGACEPIVVISVWY